MENLDLFFETFAGFPVRSQVTKNKCYFIRPFHENQLYTKETLKDGRDKFTFNVVGINAEDISIEPQPSEFYGKQILSIDGKTGDWEVHYSVTLPLFKDVSPELKNGLLTLTIEYDKPVCNDVNIREIKTK